MIPNWMLYGSIATLVLIMLGGAVIAVMEAYEVYRMVKDGDR